MEYYTVTELAFGDPGPRNEPICILADIRGDDPNRKSIQIWSYGHGKVINLPRSKILRNFTPGAKAWAAITVPRWLVNAERLWGGPTEPNGEDGERRIAEYVVDRENKYTRRPGQRASTGGYDLDGGRTRRS